MTRLPPLSIRTRLALLYTALLAAALAAFGGGMYVVLSSELQRSADQSLVANAEHGAGALAQDIDANGNLAPTGRLVGQLASTGGRVIVLDEDGRELADSAPSDEARSPSGRRTSAAADAHTHAIHEVAVAGDALRMTGAGDRAARRIDDRVRRVGGQHDTAANAAGHACESRSS